MYGPVFAERVRAVGVGRPLGVWLFGSDEFSELVTLDADSVLWVVRDGRAADLVRWCLLVRARVFSKLADLLFDVQAGRVVGLMPDLSSECRPFVASD